MPPEELRLRLTHHERDSDKYHAVRAMLNNLLKLADHSHLETPNSAGQHDPVGGAGAQSRHSLQEVPRVLLHRHGAGQCLGALCHSCNIAAQTPKTIPVVFRNGGGYDFHFLLGEDSDNEHQEQGRRKRQQAREAHAHGQGRAKAAPKAKAKAAPRPLTGWCALQAAIKQGDYSHLCLRVLCKLGEKCLQMSWGPLRFVTA